MPVSWRAGRRFREAEIEEFDASASLLESYGYEAEALNYRNQAAQFGYDSELYEYDSAIAGVQKSISDNQATLIELGGEQKAFSYEIASQQSSYAATGSLIAGYGRRPSR